jgi:hypothetical protein
LRIISLLHASCCKPVEIRRVFKGKNVQIY